MTPKPAETKQEAERKPIEAWGEAKGLLPQFIPTQSRFVAGQRSRVASIGGELFASAARSNPEFWKFAAAKMLRRWFDGALVTEAEFDAAVAEAVGVTCR